MFDVSFSLTSLAAGTAGVAGFNDLGSGAGYGSRIYSESDQALVRDILLGGNGVSAGQAALGGGFGIGGALTSLSGAFDFEMVFGNTFDAGPVSLIIETATRDVPEPASLLLFGTGLAFLVHAGAAGDRSNPGAGTNTWLRTRRHDASIMWRAHARITAPAPIHGVTDTMTRP